MESATVGKGKNSLVCWSQSETANGFPFWAFAMSAQALCWLSQALLAALWKSFYNSG